MFTSPLKEIIKETETIITQLNLIKITSSQMMLFYQQT